MKADQKKVALLKRIKELEIDISIAEQYLENGSNAHWHKFRPLFKNKVKNGDLLPPHKDWVKNVFLPDREKALRKSEKLMEQFENAK